MFALVGACSPFVQFEGVLEVAGVENPDPSKMYTTCSADPEVPPGDPADPEATPRLSVESTEGGELTWHAGFGGSSVVLAARFWYDTDGDGIREPGEPEAMFSGIVGRDEGIISGNRNEVPPIYLTPTPTGDPVAEEAP